MHRTDCQNMIDLQRRQPERVIPVQWTSTKGLFMVKVQVEALDRPHLLSDVTRVLSDHGVNIMSFTKEFNERTKNDIGMIIPVVITVYADRTFSFITKTPPAAVLIKKAAGLESASGEPNKKKVGKITKEQVQKIAETKMRDLNAANMESAMSMIAGTARSMGIEVVD